MKPKGLESIEIRSIKGLVTNTNLQDLSQDFATVLDGYRADKISSIGQRDFGTRHIHVVPPLRPNACFTPVASTGFSFVAGVLTVILSAPHGKTVGQQYPVWIDEVLYSGAYNGYNGAYTATITGSATFTIAMSALSSWDGSSGIISFAPVTIVKGTSIYDSIRAKSIDVVVGKDSSNAYHLYVYDTDPWTGLEKWIDLGNAVTGTVDTVSSVGGDLYKITLTGLSTPLPSDTRLLQGYFLGDAGQTASIVAGSASGGYIVVASASIISASDSVIISLSKDVAAGLAIDIPTSIRPVDQQRKVILNTGSGIFRAQYKPEASFGAQLGLDPECTHQPVNLAATADTSTGTLIATDYVFRVSAVTSGGTSLQSASATATLASPGNIALTWDAVTGATSYIVTAAVYVPSGTPGYGGSYVWTATSATNSMTLSAMPSGYSVGGIMQWNVDTINFTPVASLDLQSLSIPEPEGWRLEYGNMPRYCIDVGLISFDGTVISGSQLQTGSVFSVLTKDSVGANDWIELVGQPLYGIAVGTTETRPNALSFFITLVMDGYQESDPIAKGRFILDSTTVSGASGLGMIDSRYVFDRLWLTLLVHQGYMSGRATAANVYLAGQNFANNTSADLFQPSPAQHRLVASVQLRQNYADYAQQVFSFISPNNTVSPPVVTEGKYYLSTFPVFDGTNPFTSTSGDNNIVWSLQLLMDANMIPSLGGLAIDAALGHTPVVPAEGNSQRDGLIPRYTARVGRSQVSLVAVDQDDNTVRICSEDGYGTVEDENFPQISKDVNGNRLIGYLDSRGPLLGLAFRNQALICLKPTELEIIDLFSGSQDVIPCDAVAPLSIVQTEYGVIWAGRFGFYLLPIDGSGPVRISLPISNKYDGTLLTADGYPYIADPSTIIGGYDRLYKEAAFYAQMRDENDPSSVVPTLLRYNFEHGRWFFRRLTWASLAYLSKREDVSLVLGDEYGPLKYPVPGLYADNQHINYAGSTTDSGSSFTDEIKVNLGQVYGLHRNSVPFDFLLDASGQQGTIAVSLYKDMESEAFAGPFNVALNGYPFRVRVPSPGQCQSIQVGLSSSAATNVDISRIEIGLIPQVRAD